MFTIKRATAIQIISAQPGITELASSPRGGERQSESNKALLQHDHAGTSECTYTCSTATTMYEVLVGFLVSDYLAICTCLVMTRE